MSKKANAIKAGRCLAHGSTQGNYSSLWTPHAKPQGSLRFVPQMPKPSTEPQSAPQEAIEFVRRALERKPGITRAELRNQVNVALSVLIFQKKARFEESGVQNIPAKFYLEKDDAIEHPH